jgi:DNA-binding CsgD family transcriptional regulator
MARTIARTWRWLTPAEREWAAMELREHGDVAAVARMLGCSQKTVWRIREQWALRRRAAARSALRLCFAERERIALGLAAGKTMRQIARELGRSASTVSREVGRCGGRGGYRALAAERAARRRSRRPKPTSSSAAPACGPRSRRGSASSGRPSRSRPD